MRHFIAYHNTERMGWHLHDRDPFRVLTRKPVRHLVNQTVWFVVSQGALPRRYSLGSVFVGSMEHAAVMLEQALPYGTDHLSADLVQLAAEIVDRYRAEKRIIPGIGHPIHKPVDPRVLRLFAIAAETGFNGRYVDLMKCIHARAEAASGRMMPINATGAIGALACELGFPPRSVRGLGVLARAIGLVGHIMEEWEQPMAVEIWRRVDEEVSEAARKKRSA